jgi:predicted Zn-dependent protease
LVNFVRILCLFILVTSCAPSNEEAFTNTRSTASLNSVPSRWNKNAFPLTVSVSNQFEINEITAINDMASQWVSATDNRIQFFQFGPLISEKGTSNVNAYNDSVIGIYKLTNWPSAFPATALAVTQIFGKRRNIGSVSEYIQIEHADIMFNYQNFSFTTTYEFGYDLQTVILHELGHLLGLYHDTSSPDDSVMYPTISRFRENRAPKYRDVENINEHYPDYSLNHSGHQHKLSLPKQEESPQDDGQAVVLIYEMHASGLENLTIKNRN